MTLEDLNQLHAVGKLIEYDKQKLLELWDRVGILHGPEISGLPKARCTSDVLPETVKKERDLVEDIANLQSMYDGALAWINALPNARTRLIARLRFIECKTWEEVATAMEGRETDVTVRKALYRYLE